MALTPTAKAVSAWSDQIVSDASSGSPPRLASPVPGARVSVSAYNCPAIRTSPMPDSMPWTTATEIARNQRPSRSAPMASCSTPAASTSAPSALSPNSWTASYTRTVSPAAGPLTWRLLPGSKPVSRPPTMPVTSPSSAGTPEATATPTHSGTATRKTTREAVKSARMSDVL